MKDGRPIVRLLQQRQWVSAAQLSQSLGYHRKQVKEEIATLKQRGLGIDCDVLRGYRLRDRITLIDEDRLVDFLGHASLVTAARLMVFDSVDSTNDQLLQWMDRNTLHGRACISEYQSMGRGRHGRSWLSAPYCNVAFSLAWRTRFNLTELSAVSITSGLAVARVLERAGLAGVQLKWPNDIVFAQGKLSGILVEVKNSSDNGSDIVIGVGVNLYNPAVVNEQVGKVVANLQELVSTPIDRTQLIGELLIELSTVLDQMDGRSFANDAEEWNRRDAYLGLQVIGYFGDRQIFGESLGVDEFGAYCVRDLSGYTHRLISGEVTRLRMQPSSPNEKVSFDRRCGVRD